MEIVRDRVMARLRAPKPDKLWLGDRGVSQRLCLLKLQLGYTGPSPDKMIHAFQLATHLDQRRL